MRSASLAGSPEYADNSRLGIHLWYADLAELLPASKTQPRCSYLKAYGDFSLRVKNLERGSEKYSL
jgi:hypothetical protein